jgi:dienelactone hydrolase
MSEPMELQPGITRRALLAGGASAALLAGTGANAAQKFFREDIREAGLVGTLFLPAEPIGLPAVVSLTGALGGLWEAAAKALAIAGFPALALATHNCDGRPPRMRLLPVEYVTTAAGWLRQRVRPADDAVVLRGWSRGGELALLAASLDPAIRAVLAYAPRCYVGREQDRPNNFNDPAVVAAFTWRGLPVEGVPLPPAMRADAGRPTLEDLHGIAVERIAGPVMLVSGDSDTGLAGTTARSGCNQAMRRLELFHSPHRRIHEHYPDAGHSIAGPPPFAGPAEEGGSVAGDAAAVAASWPISLDFLRMAGQA